MAITPQLFTEWRKFMITLQTKGENFSIDIFLPDELFDYELIEVSIASQLSVFVQKNFTDFNCGFTGADELAKFTAILQNCKIASNDKKCHTLLFILVSNFLSSFGAINLEHFFETEFEQFQKSITYHLHELGGPGCYRTKNFDVFITDHVIKK